MEDGTGLCYNALHQLLEWCARIWRRTGKRIYVVQDELSWFVVYGQIVAIVWMVLFNLNLLPSIAIGSLISSFLMGGMLLSYTLSHDIAWDEGLPYFLVILPSDAIAVYYASMYAESLSEKWLSLLISVLSFTIGIVTTAVVLSG